VTTNKPHTNEPRNNWSHSESIAMDVLHDQPTNEDQRHIGSWRIRYMTCLCRPLCPCAWEHTFVQTASQISQQRHYAAVYHHRPQRETARKTRIHDRREYRDFCRMPRASLVAAILRHGRGYRATNLTCIEINNVFHICSIALFFRPTCLYQVFPLLPIEEHGLKKLLLYFYHL